MSHQASAQHTDLFNDQLWRLNNLYWIVDKKGNRIPFRMNDSQIRLYHDMWYRTVILKARQRGFTTFLDIFGLDQCIFNKDYKAGIIAHTLNDAQEIFRTKVKLPYESLPEGVRNAVSAESSTTTSYEFSNGSTIDVSTSYRSGTLQYLHISEYGKIAAKTPEKAIEIKTGAIEAVPLDGIVAIESTAEGKFGEFYNYCSAAVQAKEAGEDLGRLDYEFFFEPWWRNEEYQQEKLEVIDDEKAAYFETLEKIGIDLTDNQKSWYVSKERTLLDYMKREYPSTPEEAFEITLVGAIFGKQAAKLKKEGRLCNLPIEPGHEVHCSYDLGKSDETAIWFFQHIDRMYHFVDYFECNLEDVEFYVKHVKSLNYNLGQTLMPHDGDHERLGMQSSIVKQFEDGGIMNIKVVPVVKNKETSIQAAREKMPLCRFHNGDDERGKRVKAGFDSLCTYRYLYKENQGVYEAKPYHDRHSNCADAFQCFAMGYKPTSGAFDTSRWNKGAGVR